MTTCRELGRRIVVVAAVTAAGTVIAGGCTTEQVRAVAAGIDIVINNLDRDDDISFGDWIESELAD